MPRNAFILIAAAALSACATDHNNLKNSVPAESAVRAINPACPDLAGWSARQLYGDWDVELTDLGERGRLTLRRHPEFGESLRGEFSYGGHVSIASGDIEEGEVNLDESRDGKSLYAFWTGQLVPAACGREIRGTWQEFARPGEAARESRFVLRRTAAAPGARW